METKYFENQTLELDSEVLLYVQLADIMRDVISSYRLAEYDQLPTEKFFSEHYHIGRSTVRKAIDALVEEGIVARVQGKGTFVTKGKIARKIEEIYSFSNEIRESGLTPSSRLISITLDPPDEFLKKTLTIQDNERIYCINRLRLADNEPLLLEFTYVPFSFLGVLSSKALETGSLYQMLQDSGIEPFSAVESYEAINLKKKYTELLDCKTNCPGFKIERRTTIKNGDTFEYTRAYMRGDRSKLFVTLGGSKITINKVSAR